MKSRKLIWIISLLLIGCDDIGTYEACGMKGTSVFCSKYNFDKARFEGEFVDKPFGYLDGALCIPKKPFLTEMKPRLKDIVRVKADSKKKKIVIDGYLDYRDTYEIK